VLVIGSFLVTLGVIALLNGGEFRAAATLSGSGETMAAQAEAIPSSGALAGTPASTLAFVRRVDGNKPPALRRPARQARPGEPEPALGIIFDDAWLLLIGGAGVICMGKGLRLLGGQPSLPIPRSA
jgi:hypothetical protein